MEAVSSIHLWRDRQFDFGFCEECLFSQLFIMARAVALDDPARPRNGSRHQALLHRAGLMMRYTLRKHP
jgi:hypothetical protein